jgi:hypothetical protein
LWLSLVVVVYHSCKKPREYFWEIEQRFKQLKEKLKYVMKDMKHRHLFVNSLIPHLKYPLRQHKFQTQVEALQEALQLEENQYQKIDPTIEVQLEENQSQKIDPTIEDLKEDLKNLNKTRVRTKEKLFGVPHVGQKDTIRTNTQHSHNTWKRDFQTLFH